MSTAATPTNSTYIWKITGSSFLGNTLEYYDFLVYGTAAATIFPNLFFSNAGPFIATLAAFATFALGFLARPLGAMAFGHLGDSRGRKVPLLITLSMMGGSTLLIGLLPTYESAGILAPMLLVSLRLLQGFAVGGEWAGAMIVVLESAPTHRRGFFSAWPNTGGFSAQILITLVFAYVYPLPKDDLLHWGWRLPFLWSAVIFIVAFWMRRHLHESPVYTQTRARGVPTSGKPARHPLRTVWFEDWRSLLLITGLRFAEALPYFLLMVFVLSYGNSALGIPKTELNMAILIASVLSFPAHGLFAMLSDRIGRRPIYFFGAIVVFVMAFPFFALLHTRSFMLITLGYVLVLNLGHNSINSVQPAFFAELFPAGRRYSGAATGREIASILSGGLTPFIATALAGPDHTRWPLVAGYVMVGAAISIIALTMAPETLHRNLHIAD